MATRFLCHVQADLIVPAQPERVARWVGKEVWVEVHADPAPNIRGAGSNSYLWAVVYRAIADETGNDVNAIHYAMKREAVRVGILPAEYILAGTALLETEPTTKQDSEVFWKYVGWLREGAETGSMFGVVFHIPEPNE
jgi:hypothetical protein